MELQVMLPFPPVDFNFDSASTSPYISAPSSPQRFGTFFFSAPTSPSRASTFYADFNQHDSLSAVPFDWEEKPGIPKNQEPQAKMMIIRENDNHEDKDFAFDFSGQLEPGSFSAADELFDGGKIKPLKPPPRLQFEGNSPFADNSISPKSPRSPKKRLKEALSPRHFRKKEFDPFEAALEETRKQSINDQRGRERIQNPTIRRKGMRSLSPFRVSDLLVDPESNNNQESSAKNGSAVSLSSTFSSFWHRKWKLKDLLLFRSASEGRATGKNYFNKYSLLRKSAEPEEVKNSSFRSTDSVGRSKRRGQVSAHELHYTANRAVAEELKKKTFLPYKQGLLGCLRFNHGIPLHEISRSFGSMDRAKG